MRKVIAALVIGGALVLSGAYLGMQMDHGRLSTLPQSVRERLGIQHQPSQVHRPVWSDGDGGGGG